MAPAFGTLAVRDVYATTSPWGCGGGRRFAGRCLERSRVGSVRVG